MYSMRAGLLKQQLSCQKQKLQNLHWSKVDDGWWPKKNNLDLKQVS